MKIAIVGATGYTGQPITHEALARGHHVTALARNTGGIPAHERLRPVTVDATRVAVLALQFEGHDVVVSAFNPGKDETGLGTRAIVAAARRSGIPRLLVVGGAGSLEVATGGRLVDQPDFPPAWRAGALKTAAFLDELRSEHDLDWTFLSPAAKLVPGERTGRYRLGRDTLLTDDAGESRISTADFAVAMLDEIERPRHSRRRFTVAD